MVKYENQLQEDEFVSVRGGTSNGEVDLTDDEFLFFVLI